jgi:hypothetical protein
VERRRGVRALSLRPGDTLGPVVDVECTRCGDGHVITGALAEDSIAGSVAYPARRWLVTAGWSTAPELVPAERELYAVRAVATGVPLPAGEAATTVSSRTMYRTDRPSGSWSPATGVDVLLQRPNGKVAPVPPGCGHLPDAAALPGEVR